MGVGKAEFDCTYISKKARIKKGPLRIKLQITECFLYLFFFHSYFDFKIFKHKGDVTRSATTIFSATHRCNVGTMLEQCWNNVGTIRNNVATMLQRCVPLKIVVVTRFV